MAEEPALDQGRGDGGAVEGEVGSAAARLDVELLRDGLLADAAFAGDEDAADAAFGNAADLLADLAHPGAGRLQFARAEDAIVLHERVRRVAPVRGRDASGEVADDGLEGGEVVRVGEHPAGGRDALLPQFGDVGFGLFGENREQGPGLDPELFGDKGGESVLRSDTRLEEPLHGERHLVGDGISGAVPDDARAGLGQIAERRVEPDRVGDAEPDAEQVDLGEARLGERVEHVGQDAHARERDLGLRVAPEGDGGGDEVLGEDAEPGDEEDFLALFHAVSLTRAGPGRQPSSPVTRSTEVEAQRRTAASEAQRRTPRRVRVTAV